MKDIQQTYTLTCDQCGSIFESSNAFPAPQLCFVCLPLFEAGRQEGRREVVEQPHIEGKCTGDLECFCMVKTNECDDPHDRDHFPKEPMYPSDIANGEGRLIFISQTKLKEWGL